MDGLCALDVHRLAGVAMTSPARISVRPVATHTARVTMDTIYALVCAAFPTASQGVGDVEPRTVIERASFPAEPIDAFGIPQATVKCLELAECHTDGRLSASQQMGPKEALSRYAERLREDYRQASAGGSGPHVLDCPSVLEQPRATPMRTLRHRRAKVDTELDFDGRVSRRGQLPVARLMVVTPTRRAVKYPGLVLHVGSNA
ncbi:uncharacterized protein C8Q71DRAFT_165116 [Rhodofomes roseus]|uniref:Uncharacterized protein n=1 Tax=Rhodofomes roseus TaxID=34475 RepID=A0ABQ8K9X5_9APHY|nr:uncharacterized protein C8Q71DRAFT_165116 [Rhodofomes roseus]KAH9834176.1 hypothetical protein C8Q71DRAFT_165116 [Rhodofomes roseus]